MSATTILYDDRVTDVASAKVTGEQLWLTPAELRAVTGWKLETEGLCKEAACVRVDPQWLDTAGRINLSAFAGHLGQPLTREPAHDAWAFGESVNARRDALFGLEAPNFTLPDLDGKLHSLSDYRGKKVFMYSWGSY
ncbi:MAG: redoxin domain-containing protein [Gammaproteobacteria bacterium]|nr:redoxin domain-containing protein [Gammaproteobacteria bacterium]